ncbi:MAG TPA: hypothetical protein DHV42_04625 [Lachnospiraceae bacterium]|nr:hypothetical protein [Lachnospiraceae bacterium]
MQLDFHYYATYCAAYLAGYSHEESLKVCYSAQFPDNCTRTFLAGVRAPISAATTQTAVEMADVNTDPVGLQDITRIWASFHFLPYDLYAHVGKGGKRYQNKYRLICNPNGELLKETVNLVRGKSLEAVGMAMHILADTWAHRYFAGTPSVVINSTNTYFYELLETNGAWTERPVNFKHMPGENIEQCSYINSLGTSSETSVMNLGHGRAGHLPDYSFIRYKFMPAWNNNQFIYKDNPEDYYHAFCQMIYAMTYLRSGTGTFETGVYATDIAKPYEKEIHRIIEKRQLDACADWKAFGEKLSGQKIPDFSVDVFRNEYLSASEKEKDDTGLGQFILAALDHKSMVTNRIYKSGSLLAGYSMEYDGKNVGIKDYLKLLGLRRKRGEVK